MRDLVAIVVRGEDHKGRGLDPALVLGVVVAVAVVLMLLCLRWTLILADCRRPSSVV